MKSITKKLLCVGLLLGAVLNSNGQEKKPKFKKEDRKFNSWSVGLYGGLPFIQGADLNTIGGATTDFGYNFELNVTKWVSHSFGLQLAGQIGKTKQSTGAGYNVKSLYFAGETDYKLISANAVFNFSNFLRRTDNKTPMTWALYGFAGAGLTDYTTNMKIVPSVPGDYSFYNSSLTSIKSRFNELSMFAKLGLELKHKITKNIDLGLKVTAVITGDDEFDGSNPMDPLLSEIEEGRDDVMYTADLGVTYHFGKMDKLVWTDPFMNISANKGNSKQPQLDFDFDDDDADGVVNQFDLEPDTLAGAIVDGSGKALDIDRDGVFDGLDACPLVKGLKKFEGCNDPNAKKKTITTQSLKVINDQLTGIEFDTNKAIIKPKYFGILDDAAKVMKDYPDANFTIYGHTDCRGTQSANQRLSLRRANSVKKYLTSKAGVSATRLITVGKGERSPLKPCLPCTACNQDDLLINRRIEFVEDRPLMKVEKSTVEIPIN